MRNKKIAKFLMLFVMVLMLIFSCVSVSAVENNEAYNQNIQISPLDFGNQNDYAGGDWGGGSDWDSGGNWGYSSGTYNDDSDSPPLTIIIIAVVFILIIIAGVYAKSPKKSGGAKQGSNQGQFFTAPDRTSEIEDLIKRRDPNFSAPDFITFGKEVFVDMQEGWSARDLSKIRMVMHDNLYNQTQKQIDEKIRLGLVNHIENIAVSTAYLTAYKRDKQFEYLTMYLSARFVDYEQEEESGKIIRGNKTDRWEMRYAMKFMRSTNVKTKVENDVLKSHNCPNCGAPLQMESSGICEYCGSVVTTGQYSWVICDHTSIRNDTVDEGISVEDDNNQNDNPNANQDNSQNANPTDNQDDSQDNNPNNQ